MAKKATEKVETAEPQPAKTEKTASAGLRESPWLLQTPPGTSEFAANRDEAAEPPVLVVRVGKTELRYQLRCLTDLHARLKEHDEQEPAAEGTVEAWCILS